MANLGRVLVIAGSDSGGGAGIQGDIKTITCLGGYAASAITALTAQNTRGVFGIHDVPEAFIRQQITLVLDDIGADAIKTGMLHRADSIHTIAQSIADHGAHVPLVLDPVMFAKGGAALLEQSALEALRTELMPLARLITPNIPEAEFLCGFAIRDVSDMRKAAEKLHLGAGSAVLLKGGHLESDTLTDILMHDGQITEFTSVRIDTRHTHGTGCTLASAVACGLAQGMALIAAIERARAYVRNAIVAAPNLGSGHGPLKHNFMISDNRLTDAA